MRKARRPSVQKQKSCPVERIGVTFPDSRTGFPESIVHIAAACQGGIELGHEQRRCDIAGFAHIYQMYIAIEN